MLKRVTGALFEGPANSQVQLVVISQSNNGVESARFEYDNRILPPETVQGHPAGSFTLLSSIQQFETLVVFDPGAPPAARYDLFEVNSAGGLTALGESVTNAAGTPIIGFGIDGVAAAVARMARAKRPLRPPKARRKPARKAPAKKAPTKTAKAAKTKKKVARSTRRAKRVAKRPRRR